MQVNREYVVVKSSVLGASSKLEKALTLVEKIGEYTELVNAALEDLLGVESMETRIGKDLCTQLILWMRGVGEITIAAVGLCRDLSRVLKETNDNEFYQVSRAKDCLYKSLVQVKSKSAPTAAATTTTTTTTTPFSGISTSSTKLKNDCLVHEETTERDMERAVIMASTRVTACVGDAYRRLHLAVEKTGKALEAGSRAIVTPSANIEDDDDEDEDTTLHGSFGENPTKSALEEAALSINTSSTANERKRLTEKYSPPPKNRQELDDLIQAATLDCSLPLTEKYDLVLDDAVALRHATPATPGRVLVTQAQIKFEPYPGTQQAQVFAAARAVSGFILPLDALLLDDDSSLQDVIDSREDTNSILSIVAREGSVFRLCLKFARSSLCSTATAKQHKTIAQVLMAVLIESNQKRKAPCALAPPADTGTTNPYTSRRSNTVFGDCSNAELRLASDYVRLGVDESTFWRRTSANANYALCPTYPSLLFAPTELSDAELEDAASFRSKRRLLALSWRDKSVSDHELVILRCAQPLAGVQQKTNINDERMLRLVARGCCTQEKMNESMPAKVHVFDARPYVNVAANALAGKGVEAVKSYAKEDVKVQLSFLNIENIHVVRSAYRDLRKAIDASASLGWVGNRGVKEEDEDLFGFDEEAARVALRAAHGKRQRLGQRLGKAPKKNWLDHISSILRGGLEISRCIIDDKTSVLVHCSDGWDRTAQLTSLSMLLIDPYYRTLNGFAVLVDKEWCAFGHMFSKRNAGSAGPKQSSPIFLQWLDAVWQIYRQIPAAFEFNEFFLELLAERAYAPYTYSTFDADCEKYRKYTLLQHDRPSAWDDLFIDPSYKNLKYDASTPSVIHPLATPAKLRIWPGHARRWTLRRRDFAPLSKDELVLATLGTKESLTSPKEPPPGKPPRKLPLPGLIPMPPPVPTTPAPPIPQEEDQSPESSPDPPQCWGPLVAEADAEEAPPKAKPLPPPMPQHKPAVRKKSFYQYEDLKAPGPFPADVDHSEREFHLEDDAFEDILGCTKEAWSAIPKWKKDKRKQELSLF